VNDEVRRVVECLRRYDPDKIILFGSYARGDADEYSDIDLLIIKQTDQPFLARLDEVARLIDPPRHVEALVYTPAELEQMIQQGNDFILTALEDGKVIYEKTRQGAGRPLAGTGDG
jgi:predicted nucleotidyltransferase